MLCVVLRGHWEWALVVCESWQRLRSSRGRRKHKPRQQVREGGRGWGYWGWKGIQCTNSQSLSWLNQSFWCLSHPWICHSCLKMLWSIGKVWRVQPRAPCLCLWDCTPARFYLCQKRRPKSKLQWHSWPVRVPPAFSEEVRSLSVADLLKKRMFPLMGQPNRFQIFISPSVHTGSGQSEGETGGRGGRGDHGKSGRKDQNPGWGSPPGGAWKSRVRRRCNSREVL